MTAVWSHHCAATTQGDDEWTDVHMVPSAERVQRFPMSAVRLPTLALTEEANAGVGASSLPGFDEVARGRQNFMTTALREQFGGVTVVKLRIDTHEPSPNDRS